MRDALTEIDEQPIIGVMTNGHSMAPTTPASATATPAPARQADAVMERLKEAGLPYIESDDPVGACTLSDGARLTLRELDGLDETYCEQFLDHFGLKIEGAGRATSLRFMALMSISHVDDKEQAEVRHVAQLERLLKYKRPDQGRIVAAYLRYNLSNAEGSGAFR